VGEVRDAHHAVQRSVSHHTCFILTCRIFCHSCHMLLDVTCEYLSFRSRRPGLPLSGILGSTCMRGREETESGVAWSSLERRLLA
jgi:hypothetical protein